ncbi:hypothetical protein NP233_g2562 [Leucocoprinus birnbaumii]|uniref:Core-binding (CB) domain-containing protein n=1 Tax=Leucocoprinus birnbaumii TaxID=56174 RepID=A0AAD5VY57_9AGAR|nr:hypothetical protein NP233_g2562 [Leucocoprinus birnbaumii]
MVMETTAAARNTSTNIAYDSHFRAYHDFTTAHHLDLEPTSKNLARFVCYMSKLVKPSTAETYLSGIVARLRYSYPGIKDARNSDLVRDAIAGSKRCRGSPTHRKAPLTTDHLLSVVNAFATNADIDDTLFLAVTVVGFFGLLRLGELTDPNDIRLINRKKTIRRDSLIINDDELYFTLPASKTDKFFAGNEVRLHKSAAKFCPVTALQRYLSFRDHQIPPIPLALANKPRFPALAEMGELLFLARNGVSWDIIQALGRWSSETFRIYIRQHPLLIHEAASRHGLDECQGDKAQVEIIHLISNLVLRYPESPLIWVISSRPEPHIETAFNSKAVKPSRWVYFLPVDSDDACRDVETFLSSAFTEIREKYPYIVQPWPKASQFLKVARAASGLFVFAVTLTKFIDDPHIGDPITHLELVLDLSASPPQDPLEALHQLCTRILDNVPDQLLPTTKLLLGCNLLGVAHHIAWAALSKLHSVVQVPVLHFADASGFSFFHASFGDYLRDEWRSRKYAVDLDGSSRPLQISPYPYVGRILTPKKILLLQTYPLGALSLSPDILVQAFHELDFSRLFCSYMSSDGDSSPEEFLIWILSAELPETLEDARLIERTSLRYLDLTRIDERKVSLALYYKDDKVDLVCSGESTLGFKQYFPSSCLQDNSLLAQVSKLQADRLSQLELGLPDAPLVLVGNRNMSRACAIVYTSDSNWQERTCQK